MLLVAKKIHDSIDILLRDGLLFEHAFERIFEAVGGEPFEDRIDPPGKFLQIAALEMGCNPIKIRIGSKHHQISGIRLPTAAEFHGKQQFSLRNLRCYRVASSELRRNGMLCQIAVRPLGFRLATPQRIDHRVEPNEIADIFLEPDGTAFVAVIPFDVGNFLIVAVSEKCSVVVDRLPGNDDIDIRREPLVERCDRPSANQNVRSLSVDDCVQRFQ
ncbi:hypothetical protein [Halosimplex sp. TS25]|uniref:hypothetical protein n=1 Tax=Halosimplex rarum TaxID=3396619 RepID=UPI0039E870F2